MADAQPSDADPDDGRHETVTERLDRNWNQLLQELRVLQTGTQLLTGFLLTVAFQSTFHGLAGWQKALYLLVVSLAVISTVVALMPVALHRALFRRRAMDELVLWAGRMLRIGLVSTGAAIVGVMALVFSVAAGVLGAIVAAVLGAVLVGVMWLVLPQRLQRDAPVPHGAASA